MQNIFCLLTAIDCCCSALFTARVSTKIGVLKIWKTKISVSANIMFPYVQILNVCNKNKSQPNCILPSTMRNSCCLFISRFFFFFKGKKKSLRRKWKRRKNRLLILPIKCGIFDVFVCKLKIHWIAHTEWIFARGGWKTRCDFYLPSVCTTYNDDHFYRGALNFYSIHLLSILIQVVDTNDYFSHLMFWTRLLFDCDTQAPIF